MKSKEKLNNGITLVALIVTIIILLILAGISIQAITNTGIFTQANNAKRESEIASIKEQIALDIYEKQLEPPLGSITDEQLETILGKYGTVNKEDGTIVGITTAKGYEILLKDIYGGETVAESVPDGATVTPVNDITTWLKTGEISNQYSYTTIEQVIADSTCTQSLMNNENAMKYLARSTEFADAICASETTMTYLGQSAYVDDTVLNSDLWVQKITNSSHMEKVFYGLIPVLTSNNDNGYLCSASSYWNESVIYKSFAHKSFDYYVGQDWSAWSSLGSESADLVIEFPNVENVKLLKFYPFMNKGNISSSDTVSKYIASTITIYYKTVDNSWALLKSVYVSESDGINFNVSSIPCDLQMKGLKFSYSGPTYRDGSGRSYCAMYKAQVYGRQ